MQFRLQQAFEEDMAGERAADLQIDVLAGVVANPLAENLVVRPADESGVLFLERAVAANLSELVGTVERQRNARVMFVAFTPLTALSPRFPV